MSIYKSVAEQVYLEPIPASDDGMGLAPPETSTSRSR